MLARVDLELAAAVEADAPLVDVDHAGPRLDARDMDAPDLSLDDREVARDLRVVLRVLRGRREREQLPQPLPRLEQAPEAPERHPEVERHGGHAARAVRSLEVPQGAGGALVAQRRDAGFEARAAGE